MHRILCTTCSRNPTTWKEVEKQRAIRRVRLSRGKRSSKSIAPYQVWRATSATCIIQVYINRYLDASYRVISDFSEDADVTTTTVPGGRIQSENLSIWREGRIPYRQGDRGYNGVFLGWNRAEQKKGQPAPIPVYSISLPSTLAKEWKLGPNSVLTMSLAVTEDKADPPWKKPDDKSKDEPEDKKKKPEPTDFTVEIETSDGAVSRFPLSHFGLLPPPFKVRLTKLAKLDEIAYEKESEPIFQTIDLPLSRLHRGPRQNQNHSSTF